MKQVVQRPLIHHQIQAESCRCDFGLKHSILRELSKRECNLTVVPYNTSAQEILEMEPDGVMLTMALVTQQMYQEAIEMIKEIQGKIPIFGICLGHQLFSLANGAKTYKMKFGHRGFNHAVREMQQDELTSPHKIMDMPFHQKTYLKT